MSYVLGPLGYNCFRRDKLEREGEGGGDQNKILKINKVCVCTAVTLKSDSFHLAIVFYFTLYFFFFPRSLWNSDYLERPSKASLVLLCNAERCIFKLFQNQFQATAVTQYRHFIKSNLFLCYSFFYFFYLINELLWQKKFNIFDFFLMFLLNLLIMNIEQCRFQATMIEKKDT